MNVVIRVDASIDIGVGHVMRCLTLADALREFGMHCVFICRQQLGDLVSQIELKGFEVLLLPSVNEKISSIDKGSSENSALSWLKIDPLVDARQTRECLVGKQVDWLIVDHYGIDSTWEDFLRPCCKRIMVIDDLANRCHDCDLLLDQNLGRTESEYQQLLPTSCKKLMGPEYALLRPEFHLWREKSKNRRATPVFSRILITMGGVDKLNVTGMVLEVLKNLDLPLDLKISVVMGPHAPWLDNIQNIAREMHRPTEVLVDVENMACIMSDCDLVIGAAGSTSWERCCLGIPSIVAVQAENQVRIATALELSGAAFIFGLLDGEVQLRKYLLTLFECPDILRNMSEVASSITDGLGAQRVLTALYSRGSL